MAWADIVPGSSPAIMAIGCSRAEYPLCKAIPGCTFDGESGLWRVPLSWPAWICLTEIWARQPIAVQQPLQDWAVLKHAEVSERYRMREALDAGDGSVLRDWLIRMDDELPPNLRLDGVQRGAVACNVTWRRWLNADPRGNGKTPPLIRTLQWLDLDDAAFPALWVCTDSTPLDLQRKIATWAPQIRTVIISGTAKARKEAISKLRDGQADAGIIVWTSVRYHTRLALFPGEAYVRCSQHGGTRTAGHCEVHLKDFNYPEKDREHPDGSTWLRTVIADEAHHLAEPTSKQTRAVWWLAHHCENFYPTTGTTTVNHIGDLWPIEHAMDPAGFPVRSKFYDLFAITAPAFVGAAGEKGKEILDLNPLHAQAFYWIVEPTFRRMQREIARPGDPLPAPYEYRYPAMAAKQALFYQQIAKAGMAELPDRDLVPASAVEAFTRCWPAASTAITAADTETALGFSGKDEVTRAWPSHKITDLVEFLTVEESGQWIIAVTAPAVALMAEEKLAEVGVTSTHILGGMDYRAKDAAQLSFNEGRARVIFINAAGKESIDLPAAEGIGWLEPTPSYEVREQMEGRGDRRGRPTPLRRVVFLTPGTVDIRLWEMSFDKEEQHQRIVRDAVMLRRMLSVRPGEINDQEMIRT
jgi:hypothetical protein